jgi:AcrR family transcriptional regulator
VVTVDRAADGAGELRPLRADARRNRESLLLAAERAFSERGAEVSLEEVARRAGVGIGTLYRHFPPRDALVEAVYRREVEIVCEAAETMLRDLPPEQALAVWADCFVHHVASRRGMSIALRAMMEAESDLFAYTQERLRGAASMILTAACDAGAVRRDVDPLDVLRLLSGICLVTGPAREERVPQLVKLVLDGLRHGAGAGV